MTKGNTPPLAAFLAALDQTQFLPPEKLTLYQRRLLDRLVRHARAETDFYRDRLSPLFRADDSIDWERWQEVPIVRRAEAHASRAALMARTIPESAGATTEQETSGSTAEPFRHVTTALQSFGTSAGNERVLNWHEIDPAALTAFIWSLDQPELSAYPEGRPEKPWRMDHPESRGIDLSITTPVHQQVEWLRRKGPRILSTYPTNLREIGRIAREAGTPLAFDALLTYGEMLTPDARDGIVADFGRVPIDRYGSTEMGLIAATCPVSHRHHVMSELLLLEVVDEADVPVPAGVPGRVIVTSFYGYAMPLIRYDMGDYAAMSGSPCACGRSLPLIDRIYGRRRNIFRFADGSTVWPVMESRLVQHYVPHRYFQVVQIALDRIEYRYVPVDPGQENDIAGLTRYARQQLHGSINVDLVAMESIPRSPAGKHEDYISLIGSPGSDQSL